MAVLGVLASQKQGIFRLISGISIGQASPIPGYFLARVQSSLAVNLYFLPPAAQYAVYSNYLYLGFLILGCFR